MSADFDRLQRLLGGAELEQLRQRLRARFERGEQRDAFTLTYLSAPERRALEGLLGRAPKTASSMQLSRSELDHALARAGLAEDLRGALELLDGPISDRRAERVLYNQAWKALLESVREPRVRVLFDQPGGIALLKRCAGGDVTCATQLLEQAQRVLARVPLNGVPLAHLAAEVLGDSHALDAGQPVAALVLRACRIVTIADEQDASAADPSDAEADAQNRSTREQWARLGVTVNELAAPVLCLNLPVQANSPCGEVVRAASGHGEPVHLTLRALLRNPPAWSVANRVVFACENPSIVALAADRLDTHCAPLVCTDGMPAAAQRTLLQQLAAAGARLFYHGDFDWAGLRIGNFVMRELGATPWRFGTNDYLAARAESGPRLAQDAPVAAIWDERLAGAMAKCGFAVHEERVAEALLEDLAKEN